ncbi:hypothetical protein GOP47_0018626 [Adiantum capillus-veneris]|uniref:PRONE domain-containing protein n=1 Tax=Adiantum capillus-veneris TaxID=13818 RepID=A0A9D4UE26_ADICA|nr:hypothetical protein GOP47_0018626 [Adiantum capillus-veneris]
MSWLLSVSDHIVEFVPSSQIRSNDSITEVMVTKQISDLHVNLPVLCKLDNMLIEALDSFKVTKFWHADQTNTLQREQINQVLKAASAINARVLSEAATNQRRTLTRF